MDRLRRGDVDRGIQNSRVTLRGSTYKTLRVTGGAARFAGRTSGKAIRTAGNLGMNRIKRALLGGDRSEIRKYLTEEELRRWNSLSSYQKKKIIKQAGKYAEKEVGRRTGIHERPGILAGKMNRIARQKISYRYERDSYYAADGYEEQNTFRSTDYYRPEYRGGNPEPGVGQLEAVSGEDGAQEDELHIGVVNENPGNNVMQKRQAVKPDAVEPDMTEQICVTGIVTGAGGPESGKKVVPKSEALSGSLKNSISQGIREVAPAADMAGTSAGRVGARRTSMSGTVDAGSAVKTYPDNEPGNLQGTISYEKGGGDSSYLKAERKYKKSVSKENRMKATAFLTEVLRSVNKSSERSRRVEAQYRSRQISIDRIADDVRARTQSTILFPVKLGVKRFVRNSLKKFGNYILKLIPPFLQHFVIWFLGGAALLLLLLMVLCMLMAGGSQERQADLGLWRLTGYCNCYECCGIYAGGPTASGVMPVEGRTVAIHETTMEAFGLQFGDKLMIRDHIYTLEDHGGSEMGGSNGGKCVDIYVEEHNDCFRDDINGYANIYLVSEDGGLSLIGSGTGSDVVAYAEQFLGCPYVWGGSSLTEGCDCSHFVWLVLMNCGLYNGEYLTSGEWAYAGTAVGSLAEARAGDIVVYSGHVAIYDGAGMIVEAKGSAWGITHDRNVTCKPIVAIRRFT